jgi:ABC-2 type transport system ATP-binding protein
VEAVRGVSFEVAEGGVFALIGPNGAGKTSTVEILEGPVSSVVGGRRVGAAPGGEEESGRWGAAGAGMASGVADEGRSVNQGLCPIHAPR